MRHEKDNLKPPMRYSAAYPTGAERAAKRMKVSRPYITKVLHEDVNFSFRTAAKLANALKMDFFPTLRHQESTENIDVG